jgi:hypothetical protein
LKAPLAEDGAKMVRDAQRHDEGVGERAGAHDGRHDHVAEESR